MVITIFYADKLPMRIVTSPADIGSSDMCATREQIFIEDGALRWSPQTLDAVKAKWHAPYALQAKGTKTRRGYNWILSEGSDVTISEAVIDLSFFNASYEIASKRIMAGAIGIDIDNTRFVITTDGEILAVTAQDNAADEDSLSRTLGVKECSPASTVTSSIPHSEISDAYQYEY